MPTVVIALTSGTRWVVPADCTSATIECIGAGYYGDSPAHGGAYSKTNKISLTPNSAVWINIGALGGNTWFSKTSSAAPSSTGDGCLAVGGSTAPSSQVESGVGDLKYYGGIGYPSATYAGCCSPPNLTGGGGGAAGPNGNGGDAGSGVSGTNYYGGGGGANGGSAGASNPSGGSVNGGNNRFGVGAGTSTTQSYQGGGGRGTDAVDSGLIWGSQEDIWTDWLGVKYGPGGGQGGSGNGGSSYGGGYGGGGTYTSGLIIITYTATPQTATWTEVYTKSTSTIRIPYGCTQIVAEGIGAGATMAFRLGTINDGGGGGAYAKSIITTGLVGNSKAYAQVQEVISVYSRDTWFNVSANSAPTDSSTGIVAKTSTSITGGQASSCIGTTTYSGGDGGFGSYTSLTIRRGGGGGGAAGPSGAGKAGGNAYSYTTNIAGTGGGGGGSNGGSSTAGGNGTSTVSGPGGAGNGGTGGGVGTGVNNTYNGTNGGGGNGMSRGSSSTAYYSGVGGKQAIWTAAGIGTTYGPCGGNGGSGATNGTTTFSYAGSSTDSTAAGGGGGGGRILDYGRSSPPAYAAPGLLALTFTTTAANYKENATAQIIG